MGLGKKTIDDQNYCGKKVLVRCDFNVPMKDGVITNENRINAALPTIQKLVNDGAKVILCSHLGKPKNGPEAKFSLAPVAARLSEYLGKPVVFADAATVVRHAEIADAAVADFHRNRAGPRVQRVLHQFLDGGGRTLHHFACRDFANDLIGQELNLSCHLLSFLSVFPTFGRFL